MTTDAARSGACVVAAMRREDSIDADAGRYMIGMALLDLHAIARRPIQVGT